jgi:hypothetical protein
MPAAVIGRLVGAFVISFLILRAMLYTVRRILYPPKRILVAYLMSMALALLLASFNFGIRGALENYGLPITLFACVEMLRSRKTKTENPAP